MIDRAKTSRRDFLKASAIAGAAMAGGLSLARSAHAAGSDIIKVALIGCGGRGNGAIRDCLSADPAVRVIAVADAFEDKAKLAAERLRKDENFAPRVDLPPERVFAGLDAYQKALAAGVDMIVTATPPGFRPMIYAAAIQAGKHVFMEKPCCVDAPGFRQLMETNKLAEEKGLKVGVGFQRRHSPNYIETIKRIRDGAIGKLMYLRAYYNTSGIWNRSRAELAKTLGREPTEMEFQVNNWYHFCWLSGDNICEQHIHDIDACNWVKGEHPVAANGMGGCTLRYVGKTKGSGQIFDHHFVEFTYPDGAKLFSQCRQMAGCFNLVGVAAHGTEGESDCSSYIKGKNEWVVPGRARGEAKGKAKGKRVPGGVNANVQEHKDLIAAIRSGAKYCEGWHGATSSMTTVLGRMATYSGQVVTWEDAVAKGTSEFPATLAWDAKAPVYPDNDGNYPIPVPGVFKSY
jgi:myo-inositol 2-dehydrogenase/D-chiro-inositol 1-dehydrogenase